MIKENDNMHKMEEEKRKRSEIEKFIKSHCFVKGIIKQ